MSKSLNSHAPNKKCQEIGIYFEIPRYCVDICARGELVIKMFIVSCLNDSVCYLYAFMIEVVMIYTKIRGRNGWYMVVIIRCGVKGGRTPALDLLLK